MPTGTNKISKPSKTDCARWLNLHGEEVTKLKKLYALYRVKCVHGGRLRHDCFGFWLKEHYAKDFNKVYDGWFVKHPELLATIYGSDTEQL